MQNELISNLSRATAWPGNPAPARLVETHISWLLLAGDFAYKIKKPLDLGFLDFSQLEQRREACQEELRLNRRLAADIYLEVLPISGTPASPRPGDPSDPIEYAVAMRRFPDDAVLTIQLSDGKLSMEDCRQLGRDIAVFHDGLAPDLSRGCPDSVWEPVADSLNMLAELGVPCSGSDGLDTLRSSLSRRYSGASGLLQQRQAAGRVRECHGDLHLGNLVRLPRGIVPFDALEFDPDLRWTDVMAEVAFLLMDLGVRERCDLAHAFLDGYLAQSGDFDGLPLLPLLLAARALVRAKVTLLAPDGTQPAARAACRKLLQFAARPALLPRQPQLLLVCGPSGTGKTWLARQLSAPLSAIHLRSDVERKRLAGLAEQASSHSAPGQGLYTTERSLATYERLARLAGIVLDAGFSVLVDAAALEAEQRAGLLEVAHAHGVPGTLVWLHGPEALLRQRISTRIAAGNDASEATLAVLIAQLSGLDPPCHDEAARVVSLDVSQRIDVPELVEKLLA
ncbi:MAG: AAA family ATPase [Chromatiales bacterium]|nr:AAA family ATPase [Chromatiales bacterium]